MDPTTSEAQDPIIELLTTYNELNSPRVDELSELPSALEFMRYVRANRPFVVRSAAEDWSATRTWNVEILKELLEGQSVQVAVTPSGYVYTLLGSQDLALRGAETQIRLPGTKTENSSSSSHGRNNSLSQNS